MCSRHEKTIQGLNACRLTKQQQVQSFPHYMKIYRRGLQFSFLFLLQLWPVETAGASVGRVLANSLETPHTHKETLLVSMLLWSDLNVQTHTVHAHFTMHTHTCTQPFNPGATVGTNSAFFAITWKEAALLSMTYCMQCWYIQIYSKLLYNLI